MKNLLSKSLLCGVLASSFLIVNCQKAPNRAVKPQINPTAKPTAAKMAVCSADVLTELKATKDASDALKVELDKATGDLSDETKNALTDLANKLLPQSKKLITTIQALTVGDKKEAADGCNEADGKSSHVVGNIKAVISALGKTTKVKTGLDNDITKEDAAAAQEVLKAGDELKLKAELAAILSDDANSNGAVAVVESKIVKGDEAKAALADVSKTACALVITKKEAVVEGTSVKVLTLEDVKLDEKTKRNVLTVNVEVLLKAAGAGNSTSSLICNIADTKEAAAAVEVRKALKDLVDDVVKALPATEVTAPKVEKVTTKKAIAQTEKKTVFTATAGIRG